LLRHKTPELHKFGENDAKQGGKYTLLIYRGQFVEGNLIEGTLCCTFATELWEGMIIVKKNDGKTYQGNGAVWTEIMHKRGDLYRFFSQEVCTQPQICARINKRKHRFYILLHLKREERAVFRSQKRCFLSQRLLGKPINRAFSDFFTCGQAHGRNVLEW
jgi:hypothetical protein